MAFSLDGINWEPWENFSTSRYYSVEASVKAKHIHFRVKDRAGNIAEPIAIELEEAKDKEPGKTSFFIQHWYILFIILITIIILIFVVLVKKRKKQDEQEEPPPEEAVTIKPGTIPKTVISVGEMSPAPALPQLTETTAGTEVKPPTLAPQAVPTLASPTSPGKVPVAQQIPSPAQVPRLLPATTIEDVSPKVTHPQISPEQQIQQQP